MEARLCQLGITSGSNSQENDQLLGVVQCKKELANIIERTPLSKQRNKPTSGNADRSRQAGAAKQAGLGDDL
jgi:hypothetical protein